MEAEGSATVAQGSAASAEDGGLTVAQYAEQHGISTDSVRRRLKADELSGHRRPTKHGEAWCIHPDEPPGWRQGRATVVQTVAQDSREGGATVAQGSQDVDEQPGAEDQAPPAPIAALVQAEAMAAYTRSVLEPLVAALERSEARVAELEHRTGQLGAEKMALQDQLLGAEKRISTLEAERATLAQPSAPASATPLSRFWPVLLGAVAVLLAVALLVWPR